jgi:hypothetical protein
MYAVSAPRIHIWGGGGAWYEVAGMAFCATETTNNKLNNKQNKATPMDLSFSAELSTSTWTTSDVVALANHLFP